MGKCWTNHVPVLRVEQLRKQDKKWREIGVILAQEQGRATPYQPASVQAAYIRHLKAVKRAEAEDV